MPERNSLFHSLFHNALRLEDRKSAGRAFVTYLAFTAIVGAMNGIIMFSAKDILLTGFAFYAVRMPAVIISLILIIMVIGGRVVSGGMKAAMILTSAAGAYMLGPVLGLLPMLYLLRLPPKDDVDEAELDAMRAAATHEAAAAPDDRADTAPAPAPAPDSAVPSAEATAPQTARAAISGDAEIPDDYVDPLAPYLNKPKKE